MCSIVKWNISAQIARKASFLNVISTCVICIINSRTLSLTRERNSISLFRAVCRVRMKNWRFAFRDSAVTWKGNVACISEGNAFGKRRNIEKRYWQREERVSYKFGKILSRAKINYVSPLEYTARIYILSSKRKGREERSGGTDFWKNIKYLVLEFCYVDGIQFAPRVCCFYGCRYTRNEVVLVLIKWFIFPPKYSHVRLRNTYFCYMESMQYFQM